MNPIPFPTEEMIQAADKAELTNWLSQLRPTQDEDESRRLAHIFERYMKMSLLESEKFNERLMKDHRSLNRYILPVFGLTLALWVLAANNPPC